MIKKYYRNEYSDKQWKALIDKAAELGCQVAYSKYGNTATIDSTELENGLMLNFPNSIGSLRQEWAEHIHGMIQESTDLRKWKVQPKRYHHGYCPTTFNDQSAAKHEQARLERITGFEWTIIVIPE